MISRIGTAHGDYRLSGDRTSKLTLSKNGSEIASVTKCEKRNGWWHDANEPSCAAAVIVPTARIALLALTAGDSEAPKAILAMLPENENWPPTP